MISTFGWGPGAVDLRDLRGRPAMSPGSSQDVPFWINHHEPDCRGPKARCASRRARRNGRGDRRLRAPARPAGGPAGCARQQGPQEAQAAATPKPEPAYCQPNPPPDCQFKGSTRKTVDAAEFARLKVAYERRCVRHAERVERERMRELQVAGACEGRPAPSLAASR